MPSFYTFVDKSEAEKRGIDIRNITSPYHLWNGVLDKEYYNVFPPNEQDSEDFKRYESDPRFVKIIVSCGN